MKNRKQIVFKIQSPIMSDHDFRQMLEGVMVHRENLIKYGTPYPPEAPDSEKMKQRKAELDAKIAEYQAKIQELDDTKERYNQLLRTIYEEESRIKDEQKKCLLNRSETPSNYLQGKN